MSSSSDLLNSSDNSENACVVCFKNSNLFSIGLCDHPVCFECSTRMRVLCKQFECPICRQQMPKVFFTKEVQPYQQIEQKLEEQRPPSDATYGLYFDSQATKRRYTRLLEHECLICKRAGKIPPFRKFKHLQDHMRRVHGLQYCELCVDNLKIFTSERKCYNRSDMNVHLRKGDIDDTSHRGHPLCEFCNKRFMDNDDLYRHLRRDHLYCHFCDADGKHQYYNSYGSLRKHYLEEHFLCEEGECREEQFTSVFRTDIDLKAHCASVHNKNLSRAANRQARTLELEFTLAPRNRNFRETRSSQQESAATSYSGPLPSNDEVVTEPPESVFSNPLASENFPRLGSSATTALTSSTPLSSTATTTRTNFTIKSKLMGLLSEENFPSLGPASGPALTITTSKVSKKPQNQQPGGGVSASSVLRGGGYRSTPSVTITRTVNQTNNQQQGSGSSGVVKVNFESSKREDHFPSLGRDDKQPSVATWVQVKKKGSEQQQQQEEQQKKPQNKPPAGNSNIDFPELKSSKNGSAKNNRKSTSVTVPISNSWVNLNSINNNAKNDRAIKSNKQIEQQQKKSNERENKANIKQDTNNGGSDGNSSDKTSNGKKKKGTKGTGNANSNNNNSNNVNNKSSNANNEDNLSKSASKINLGSDKKVSSTDDNLVYVTTSKQSTTGASSGVKKRTELKLQVKEATTASDDVSPLPKSPPPSNNECFEDKCVKPPPGFKLKPPPGFSGLALANNIPNDLTFTNSSGQSYSITPSKGQYHHPPNFQARNQNLRERLVEALKDADVIRTFKMYSSMFITGDIESEMYYDCCKQFTGEKFETIFPELLVLLPDIEKQQELYRLHRSKGKTKGLDVCATCSQILLATDLRSHLSNHVLDNHFPILSSTPVDNNNVWNKK